MPKMKEAVTMLVEEFGTPGEREHLQEVIKLITAVFGDQEVAEGGLAKVMDVGRQLKRMGINP